MITAKRTPLKALALVPIVLVLVVSACGGSSGGGGGGGGGEADVGAAEQAIPGEEYTPEYLQGQSTCTIQTLDAIAQDFKVKPEPKVVARAVAKSIEPKKGKKQDLVYRGCLVVLQAPAG
jgi:hypothetical protein